LLLEVSHHQLTGSLAVFIADADGAEQDGCFRAIRNIPSDALPKQQQGSF
jgi:hypothetical protein